MRASAMSSVPAMSRQRRRALAKRRPGVLSTMAGIVAGPRPGAADFSGKDGFGFDLDAPPGIEELFDDDHGGGGTDAGEDLAVGAADLLPVFGVGEIYAGADDVLEGGTGGLQRGFDELEAGAGLVGGREVFRADGAGAGDVDHVADADGAREADDGFVGRCAGNVRAGHEVDVNQVCGGSLWR